MIAYHQRHIVNAEQPFVPLRHDGEEYPVITKAQRVETNPADVQRSGSGGITKVA